MEVRIEIPDPPQRFAPVMEALLKTRGQLTQREAAALLHLSHPHFSRTFHQATGRSFRVARVEVKMAIAQQLLQSTRLPIPEIARTVGYQQRRKFDEAFKQQYAATPAQYRAR